MALFMPTAVTPSLTGALGNGVVDATKNLTVSWQVNGNSPMTGFQIVIYQNDAASTQLYTTGKRTDGCPFYGKNAQGVQQTFSYSITASLLASAGIVNGGEYKLVITQWWSSTDFVTQSSASAFITRTAPVLSMGEIGVLASKNASFTATYSQAQGDALNWARWRIAYAADTDHPFFDTQNLYGVSDLSASYDGFFSGEQYAVRLDIQTSSGVEATTGWIEFSCEYEMQVITDTVTACIAPPPMSAVYVNWNNVSYIYGEPTGEYSISKDGVLTLPAGSSVSWSSVNGDPMSIAAPWNVIFATVLPETGDAAQLLGIKNGSAWIYAGYSASERAVSVSGVGSGVKLTDVHPGAKVYLIVTPSAVYIRADQMTGGLYPNQTLYPNETLYPATDTIPQTVKQTFSASYTQSAISEIALNGEQACDYVQEIDGDIPASVLNAVYNTGTYVPDAVAGTQFLTDFMQGLNAGTTMLGGAEITGWTVYRMKKGENLLTRVIDMPLGATGVYDYGAASQQGDYVYYVFPHNDVTYLSNPVVSNPINPVFWNWTILSCTQDEDGAYVVQDEFTFGKNLQSGAISNNNSPGIFSNFTPYPAIQLAPQNYKSGTLQSMIGAIGMGTDGRYDYSDSIALRDAIFNLATTQNTLFLKNRKGDLTRIRIAGAISMTTADNTRQQIQTASVPWAEVGTADGVSIISKIQTNTASEASSVPATFSGR